MSSAHPADFRMGQQHSFLDKQQVGVGEDGGAKPQSRERAIQRWNGRTGRNEEQDVQVRQYGGIDGRKTGAGKGRMGVGGRHQAGPSTSVIVTQAIKINQSMNQSTYHQLASLTNQPTIHRIIHRSSQSDKASGATICAARLPAQCNILHSTAAHVPARVGTTAGLPITSFDLHSVDNQNPSNSSCGTLVS